MSKRDFIPFDIKCFNKLEHRFQTMFEHKLINEICKNGQLKTYKPHETLVDIGLVTKK